MRVLVLNGSPSGKNSITLQTVLYIQKFFRKPEFEILHVGQRIKSIEKSFKESREALERADLILFCYPVYTFLVPAQLHRFIELIAESGVDLSGKYAAQITTSKHFYDTTAHRFIRDNCEDLKLNYLGGLSADMEDLLAPKGQKEARDFFRLVCWKMKHGFGEPGCLIKDPYRKKLQPASILPDETDKTRSLQEKKSAKGDKGEERPADSMRIVIVADLPLEGELSPLSSMVERLRGRLECDSEVVNIREFPFTGGCLGCFHCAADGRCIYKDGFDEYLRKNIQTADAIVYAYTIQNHSMGSRFKMFDDRQFCNGHRTVTMGKPVGYLVNGFLTREQNLQTLMEARAQVGGNYLAGIASNEEDPDREIDQLADTLQYAVRHHYTEPKNFYGVGGLKIFRDLIWQMQGLMREDHRFYKEHGFYDFPQKRKGMIIGMYLAGTMMRSPLLAGKMGSRMTEGMLMPYQQVLKKAGKKEAGARKRS